MQTTKDAEKKQEKMPTNLNRRHFNSNKTINRVK